MSGALTVSKAPLTISATGIDKVYAGTKSASVTLSSDKIVGDTVNLSHSSAEFADENVGAGKNISVAGLSIAGADAGNYSLQNLTATTTAAITPAALTITAIDASKVYNRQAYTGGNGVSYTGFVNNETSSVLGGALSYTGTSQNAVNAGSYVITPQGLTASNYSVSFVSGVLTVSKAALTVSASAIDKIYDGSRTATVNLISNLYSGDQINISHALSEFSDKNAGNTKSVNISGIAISGLDAGNYSLQNTSTTSTARITPALLTAAVSANDKTYDGNTDAAARMTLSGLINNETVIATIRSATFNSKDVRSANTVTINEISLADGTHGGLASNYQLPAGQTARASISAKSLTAVATASNKTYDGTDLASVILTLGGFVDTETVHAIVRNASFNSSEVALANTVTVHALSLADGDNGGLASNYQLAAGQTMAARIWFPANQAPLFPSNPVPFAPELRIDATPRDNSPARSTAMISLNNASPLPSGGEVPQRDTAIISVTIPRNAYGGGSRLIIPLPEEALVHVNDLADTVKVTLPGDKPLPNWIKYLPAERAFITESVPQGALPMLVELSVGNQRSLVQIAESAQ